MKICSVEGCTEHAIARGWCRRHYRAWNERGHDPNTWVPHHQEFTDTHKVCYRCKEAKPLDQFAPAPRNRSGRSTYCRPCQSLQQAEWAKRMSPASEFKAELRRRRRILRRYGLTPEGYDALLASQGGACICGAREPGQRVRYFHVDHDHETGAVRGLLCHACNTAIGLTGDDPARLRLLADYVARTT